MGAQPQGVFRLGENAEQFLELFSGKGLRVGRDLADVFCREVYDLLQRLEFLLGLCLWLRRDHRSHQ